jgi:hypothetical protein
MDDETHAVEPWPGTEPRCTVCNEPVADDGQRGWTRAPGAGERPGDAAVLYHHRACARDGRIFLAAP